MAGLAKLSPAQQSAALNKLTSAKAGEHERDIERKRERRQAGAAITIPDVVDPVRREKCLADPERFLWTYGAPKPDMPVELQPGTFWMPFISYHRSMISAIYERAVDGGDKSTAAPRGGGKSTIIFWMLIYVVLARLRYHPAGFGATLGLAKRKLFDPIVDQFRNNDLLYADFPEICHPIRDLNNNALRAKKQHVDGTPTNIVCSQERLVLPTVPGSPYGGCSFDYYGFDSAFRGERHDFGAIDDPETEQVAANETLNRKLENLIDGAVAGLRFPGSTMPRVVITTIQNRHCYSFRVTSRDPAQGGKPTFEGDRHGQMMTWPGNRDLWDEYIALRQLAQGDPRVEWMAGLGWSKGLVSFADKDAWRAVRFYQAHFEEMNAGATVANPLDYDQKNPAELNAIQAFFNRIADWGLPRVMAELQNAPEEEETEQTLGLTPGLVANRISGLFQNQLPDGVGEVKIVCGLDIGNRVSHWWKLATFGNATGVIIDEGQMETRNMIKNPSQDYLTKALLEALHNWRSQMLSENPPDFGLIDSGDGHHQAAIYEFVRATAGTGTWAASKGWEPGRFRMPKPDQHGNPPKGVRLFDECYASYQPNDGVWLYNVNTEHWKRWLQERFITPTFDHNQRYNDGSLSIFAPPDGDPKRWVDFSNHICAEGREELFIPGKGYQRTWKVYNKNNHKLDAGALACAAAGVLGMRLIQRVSLDRVRPTKPRQQPKPNSRFKQRPGGWVPKRRG